MNTAGNDFYNTPEKVQALRFHAGELVDTPFAAHQMVPGAGIDCIHVNAWCYLKTGLLQSFMPPEYSLDGGRHARESKLLKWLNEDPRFKRAAEPLQAGDTVCFNMGLTEHHVGLAIDGKRFVHCLFFGPRRVVVSSFEEPYYRHRLSKIYRPVTT